MTAPNFLAPAPAGKPAIIMGGSGRCVSHGEIETESNRWTHFLNGRGIRSGDIVALCLENAPELLIIAVAAQRSGYICLPISSKLTARELAFIVEDSGARILITSPAIGGAFTALPDALPGTLLVTLGDACAGFECWHDHSAFLPTDRNGPEVMGGEMLYSSGTTGRPKGIRYERKAGEGGGAVQSAAAMLAKMGIGASDVYLSPAPLYHSSPFAWSLALLSVGATVIVMERFDAEQALRLIERHRVTVSQWVPTHFVRMLKLPVEVREQFDLASQRFAFHAAAPCPVPVKQAMIQWWGPILIEFFGSSEQTALTLIDSADWLQHPGSVGRCIRGTIHICDEEGNDLPPGETGIIYSEGAAPFSYHNDPEKTKAAYNASGFSTVGDLGYLDAEGYLYLTDRKQFMIITGGVNVYPQEIENLLVTHSRIADAAVIGLPDEDLGEIVTAVVQPLDPADANAEFAADLRSWLREQLSPVKVPKRIEFSAELPRLPTGKMVKHLLVEELNDAAAAIADATTARK